MRTFQFPEVTFAEAAKSYVEFGGEALYIPKISAYFGDKILCLITPNDIRRMAMTIYPEDRYKASTQNRCALVPAKCVMSHAHDNGWCNTIRLRKFKEEKSTLHKPVSKEWIDRFVEQCEKDKLFHLAALVIFMNHTAARRSEAAAILGEHIDFRRRTALLVRTKTGQNELAYLTDELMYRLYNLNVQPGVRVFKYTHPYSINARIKAVCRRAGIDYRPTHSCGRHSFATNALNSGVGIKTAMDAGRWRSSKIFLETYVHSENAGRMVADKFNAQRYAHM